MLDRKNIKLKLRARIKLFISVFTFLWFLSGWPQFFIFPPNIQQAQAQVSKFKLGTFAAGSGTQQVNGVGFQPKAVLFWITELASAGTTSHFRHGRGWAAYDGSGYGQGAAATAFEDGGYLDDRRDRVVNDKCITLFDHTGAIRAEASINIFHSDGFTLDWSTAGGGRLVVYLALGGDALTNAKAGGFIFGSGYVNDTKTVTVGFQPDAVFLAGVEDTSPPASFGTSTRGGHGFGIAISPSNRHSSAHRARNNYDYNEALSGSSGINGYLALAFADDSNEPELAYDFDTMLSDGFRLIIDRGDVSPDPWHDSACIYLALKGINIDSGILTQRTSTGTQTISGMSFQPSVVLFDGGDDDAVDSDLPWLGDDAGFDQNAEAVIGVATHADAYSIWSGITTHDASYPADTALSTSKAIVSYSPGTPSLWAAADLQSMNSDGFTLNWTTADSMARRIGWIAIGPPTGATLIKLKRFEARGLDGRIRIEWETETELDNEGFNLWRSEEKEDGEYVQINPYFIPAEGEAGFGAEYSYTDFDVQNGKMYFYKLEDIDIHGKSTFHGPVSATPNDIALIWPPDREILPSDVSLFSWSSTGSLSFKVEISPSPAFLNSETLSFPEDVWIISSSLWLRAEEQEMVLRLVRESGSQMFWRIRARSPAGGEVFSHWKRFVIEGPKVPEE